MPEIKIELIRHGMTPGNAQHRYIGGGTDEDLCDEGITMAGRLSNKLGQARIWLLSPMRRCLETACLAGGVPQSIVRELMEKQASSQAFVTALQQHLPPQVQVEVLEGLRECHFGTFEGHNWEELTADPAYQAWIDSEGRISFPQGEDQAGFSERTVNAFAQTIHRLISAGHIVPADEAPAVRIVAHGGTIMALMGELGLPDDNGQRRSYYEWNVPNCTVVHAHLVIDGAFIRLRPGGIEIIEPAG